MSQTVVAPAGTARDFDFWMGRWNGRNRLLRERLAGCEEWDEFESRIIARSILGGTANEDVFLTDYDGGYVGMSFRFFDPETGLWSIYWADSRRPGQLDPPVVGSFSGDVGVFEGPDTWEGRPILRSLHLVTDHDADAAVGAGVLRGRRRDLGDELRHGFHAGRRRMTSVLEHDGRGPIRLLPRREGRPARLDPRPRGRDAEVVRRRARRRAGAGGRPRARLRRGLPGNEVGRARALRRPRIRDPPPLRAELLLPARLDLAERQRALGVGLGEGRPRGAVVRAVAGRGAASADLLRLGARRRLPRAAGVGPLPALAAGRVGQEGVLARHLRGRGLSTASAFAGVAAREAARGDARERVAVEDQSLDRDLARVGLDHVQTACFAAALRSRLPEARRDRDGDALLPCSSSTSNSRRSLAADWWMWPERISSAPASTSAPRTLRRRASGRLRDRHGAPVR